MKKWVWVFLLIPLRLHAQNLGFNGAGFFENYNTDVKHWLSQWEGSFTLRIPGGAISKFHDPYNHREGWGMTEESIRQWFAKDGFDEDGQGLDKWLRKAQEQPTYSYLDEVVKLQQDFPKMKVVYVLNVLNSTPEANLQAIRYLVNKGVQVTAVEAGNEVYGKYSSFDEYRKDFEPVFQLLSKEFPHISKGLVAGANLDRQQLVRWNNEIAAYQGDYEAVILHYYYTARELGSAYTSLDKKIEYKPGIYYPSLEAAFRDALAAMVQTDLLDKGISYAERQFPGKKIWITEWNTKPSDKLNNTLLNGAWQYAEMQRHRNRVEYFLVHNGVSPDKFGMISRSNNKFDSEKTPLVRRTGYWSLQMALATGEVPELKKGVNAYVNAGKRSIWWFSNLDAAYKASVTYNKEQFKQVNLYVVSGAYLYTAGGYAGYMSKGSQRSYEIDGIDKLTFGGEIPANSYGYIEFIPK